MYVSLRKFCSPLCNSKYGVCRSAPVCRTRPLANVVTLAQSQQKDGIISMIQTPSTLATPSTYRTYRWNSAWQEGTSCSCQLWKYWDTVRQDLAQVAGLCYHRFDLITNRCRELKSYSPHKACYKQGPNWRNPKTALVPMEFTLSTNSRSYAIEHIIRDDQYWVSYSCMRGREGSLEPRILRRLSLRYFPCTTYVDLACAQLEAYWLLHFMTITSCL